MPNSTAAGYLTPAATPAPLLDDALDNFVGDLLAGVSGISRDLVRPALQVEPPTQPARTTSWIAFQVAQLIPDTYGYVSHEDDGHGNMDDLLVRHEDVEVHVIAYGPNASTNLGFIRDGLQIEQNRASLSSAGWGLTETREAIRVPEFVKDQWLNRWDMGARFKRQVQRSYPVLSLVSAQVVINDEKTTTTVNVTGP